MLIKIWFYSVAVSCSLNLQAQDANYSQFNETPALQNPALTGANHVLRASINYKDQWRSAVMPYKAYGLSFETRLGPSNWEQVDKHRSMTFKEKSLSSLAAGICIYNNKEAGGTLSSTSSNLSLAYFIPLNSHHFISVGVQGSMVQRKADNTNFLFPDQYNGTNYDRNLYSGETFNTLYYVYYDYATGILWSYSKEEKRIASNYKVKANVGFSMYHLNQPVQRFINGGQNLLTRYVIHGSAQIGSANTNFAWMPSFNVQLQGTFNEVVGGLMLKQYYRYNSKYTGFVKRSSMNYGLYYRVNDALITVLMYEIGEQYSVGMSYDFTVSGFSKSNASRGGFELLLRYTPPKGFLYEEKVPGKD